MNRLKDIPQLQRDSSNLPAVIEAIREALQTYRGYRGDPLDQALTRRDFKSGELASLVGGGTTIVDTGGGGTGGGGTLPDSTPPPTPTGLAVSAGISHIYVAHDVPTYTQGHGHGRTVVYGAKWPAGDTEPTFASAVLLFEFAGVFGAYPSDPSTRWCIWIKWRSNDGFLSAAPAGGTNGEQVTTGVDVATLLAALTNSITRSQLFEDIGTPIDLITADNTTPNSVNARIKTETDARVAAILAEVGLRVAGDSATLAGAQAYTNSYAYSVAGTDAAIAARAATLTTAFGAGDAATLTAAQSYVGIYAYSKSATDNAIALLGSTISTAYATADANVLSAANAYTYSRSAIDGAISASSTSLTASFTTADAATLASANSFTYSRAAIDGAISSASSSLTAAFTTADSTTLASANAFTYSRATIDGSIASSQNTLLARMVSRPNLAKNGGLEFGLEGMSGVSQFAVQDSIWGKTLVSFTTATGTGEVRWPSFVVSPGATYIVHADTLLFATSGSVYVDLMYYDGSDTLLADGPEHANLAGHDFSATDSNRSIVAVESVAPAGAVYAVPRFVYQSLVGCTALGVRQLKVERGSLPYTAFSSERSAGATYAAVQTESSARVAADGALFAQWTVKLDLNGYVSGFGLASTAGTAAPTSSFIVRSDSFAVASPSGPGITPAVPFIVRTTPGTVNGVPYSAGVYIEGAYILDLTAAVARMGTAWIDTAMIASLSADKITAGSISVGNYIQSSVYSSGSAGYRFDGSGNFEINNLVARGTIYASAGSIAGITMGSNYLRSPGYVAGTTGYQLRSDDTADFGSGATFGGLLKVGNPAIVGTTITGSGATFTPGGAGAFGNATTNLTFNGTTMKANGAWITDENLVLSPIVVSITGGGNIVHTTASTGFFSLGTRGVSASGGTGTLTYQWIVTLTGDPVEGGVIYVNGSTSSSSVAIKSALPLNGSSAVAIVQCIVRDANGRTAVAGFTVTSSNTA